jgi:hypothetical protein
MQRKNVGGKREEGGREGGGERKKRADVPFA